MSYLSKLTVRSRLMVGFGIILVFLVLLTVLGIQKVNFIDRTLSDITDVNSVKQRYAINFRGSVHDRAIAVRDAAMARTPQELASYERTVRELEEFYRVSEQKMNEMLRNGTPFTRQERDILSRIEQIQSDTLPLINKILADKKRMVGLADTILDEARPAFMAWLDTINEFIDYQEQQNQALTPQARRVAGGFQELMMVLSGIALVVSIVIAFVIERSFRNSLGGEPFEAQSRISKMALGDLTQHDNNDHKGSILDSLSDMRERITGIVGKVIGASNSLALQVEEVSSGSCLVLKSSKQQAALTEDTSFKLSDMRNGLEQMESIANQTEDNSGKTALYARQGREVVNEAAQEMEKISSTVHTTVEQIQRLEERTKQIGGIANVISEISEQTNLLALNAAIEAARAGDSGRGFAVVADEVRSLAKRTGDATAQIDTMINEVQSETAVSVEAMSTTQSQVENGKAQTSRASELLQDIEQQANYSLSNVKEVATAVSKQVVVVGDVSQAMGLISDMSNQSIGHMQRNEEATQILNELVSQLKQEVSFFKV